jgi:hypothetical protein
MALGSSLCWRSSMKNTSSQWRQRTSPAGIHSALPQRGQKQTSATPSPGRAMRFAVEIAAMATVAPP